jgi:hypothetical protein
MKIKVTSSLHEAKPFNLITVLWLFAVAGLL